MQKVKPRIRITQHAWTWSVSGAGFEMHARTVDQAFDMWWAGHTRNQLFLQGLLSA